MKPALIEALEKLVAWVRGELLPLWWDRGVTAEGWAATRFDQRGDPDAAGPMALASQAQLAYVFARAEHLGWSNGLQARVRQLIELAGRHGTLPCRSDGYVHSLDRRHAILDERHYLADHALFMLASTAAYKAFGDGSDARRTQNIYDWLELRLAHPQGGWFESSELRPERSARSHYHMLHTFLYLYETTQKARWLAAAEALVALGQKKLLHQQAWLYRDYREDWVAPAAATWYPEDQFLWVYGVHKFARCAGGKAGAADLYHRACESQPRLMEGLCQEAAGPGGAGAFATGGLAAALLAGISLAAEGDLQAADHLEQHLQGFFKCCDGAQFIDSRNAAGIAQSYTSAATSLTLFDAARDAASWLKSAGGT